MDSKALRRRALTLLARRDMSERSLRAALCRWLSQASRAVAETDADGPDPWTGEAVEAAVEAVVDECRQLGYLNDLSYARRRLERRGSSRGDRLLVGDLRQQGVDETTAASALADFCRDETELERARALYRRRFNTPPSDAREWQRQWRFLQSRGFDSETVRQLLKEAATVSFADPDSES